MKMIYIIFIFKLTFLINIDNTYGNYGIWVQAYSIVD